MLALSFSGINMTHSENISQQTDWTAYYDENDEVVYDVDEPY